MQVASSYLDIFKYDLYQVMEFLNWHNYITLD